MTKYTLVLISADGEQFSTDGTFDTIAKAEKYWREFGSSWFFFPFAAIINKPSYLREALSKKIIVPPYELPNLKGKKVSFFVELIKSGELDY
jgi:hypothetical protein